MRILKTSVVSLIIAITGLALSSSVFASTNSNQKGASLNTTKSPIKAATVPAAKSVAPQSVNPKSGF